MMLNNISWGLFILYCSGALLVYYVVLVVVKGSGWMAKNKDTAGSPLSNFTSVKRKWMSLTRADEKENAKPDQQLLQSIVHDLVDEIQSYFSAVEKDTSKPSIISQLKLIVAKYPSVKGSIYQEGISNLIAVSCQHHCSILLTEMEVDTIWK
jgi:hypothetical protein